ncbi:MAG: hypothetical protein M1838_003753 [Thelocarpon superellum]|nr:MAG: hypothetical protein M1838_003753 [Thelocarpon superellum]
MKKKRGGKRSKPSSISHGRPPIIRKPTTTLSSKATRSLIRGHHQLCKQHVIATAQGDLATAETLQAQLEQRGGLLKYQEASINGQSSERGGDSSKVLMDWLKPFADGLRRLPASTTTAAGAKLRMLEVGALSRDNVCARSGCFDMTRIDLHPQDDSILQQDFMARPFPRTELEMFDIISLSLVLNYVPISVSRGEMLRRLSGFLRPVADRDEEWRGVFPSVFMVLPSPCVTNSRYLNEARLEEIMSYLGFSRARRKLSAKLIYYLWRHESGPALGEVSFKKKEVHPGRIRNNFAIVLK